MANFNGVNFTRTGNPQKDLETYAAARGINASEAKKELESLFGKPKGGNEDTDTNNITLDGNEFTLTGDPDADAKSVAEKLGLSIGAAIEKLKAKFGDPSSTGITATTSTSSTTSTTDDTSTTGTTAETETTDTDTDTNSSTDATSTTSTTSDTSSSQATDRERIQKEIGKWNAKLKQATDAKDEWGVRHAQSVLRNLQTKAYEWDNSK